MVYNLEVEGNHNYFVGEIGVLSHNCAVVTRTDDVLKHIFRNADGHVNPATEAGKEEFIKLFENVAADASNLVPTADAVTRAFIPPQAAAAGKNVFTKILEDGSQVWVHVINGKITDAGVNLPGAIR